MITVIRVTGESYDLETGTQIPKAIVISNGVQELSILVDDDTARKVIGLMMDQPAVSQDMEEPISWPEAQPQVINTAQSGNTQPDAAIHELQEGDPHEIYSEPGTGTASI